MALFTVRFLRDHSDVIVRAWEASVQAEAPVVFLTGLALRDHIPELLNELADWMETTSERHGGERMHAAAVAHAVQRLEHGFELTQLIHEVRLLRKTILSLLLAGETSEQRDSGEQGMPVRVIELARLNTGLDFAIAEAVEWFVNEREHRLQALADHEIQLVRESDQRKNHFLAVLSHELRNPLAPILNSLHILDRAEPGSEEAGRAREVIQRQTMHLTRLVDDLLDTTRLSHGKIELDRARFDLRDVVRSTCDDHRELFGQCGVELLLEVPAEPVFIHGDSIRIAQIFSNLLQNAAKFALAGGKVSVAVRAGNGHASLHVRDNGVGMQPAVVEQVFEPFVQAQQNAARQKGGLGLGLALVKGLVDLHGGSVSAHSAGPGCGSEFIVELPIAPASLSVADDQVRRSHVAPSRLVLIIEDNVDSGDSLAQVLEYGGHRTHVARDGKSGIALARELKPDVVLCDIGLPDIDGHEVARQLRAEEELAATFLVALTGYAQPDDKERVKQAGFDVHLTKPPSLDELSKILARAS